MRTHIYPIVRCSLFVLLGLAIALPPPGAAAQGGGTTWDPPGNVSDTETNSANPCIVADPWGWVHLFWDEGNAIFYSRRDETAWSKPVDILISPEGSSAYATQPVAVALPDGRLAVVWAGGWGDTIYFSTAPADAAGSTQAWTYPQAIVTNRPGADQPRIALYSRNVLHVLYLHHEGENQGLWHLSSADDGRSWTTPRQLPGTYVGKPNASIFHPTFVIDGSGMLHAAWSGSSVAGGYPPDGITYSRSTDGGDTWSEPIMLATGPFGFPVLGTRGASEVHLMWSGTLDQRRKFYDWSMDGGLNWSWPRTIGESGGMQGSAQMVVDGDGELHLVFVSSQPDLMDGLFHSRWLGGNWSQPELLLRNSIGAQNLQYAVAAISDGNVLYAAVMYPLAANNSQGWQFDIFDVQGHLPARAIAAVSLPPTAAPQKIPATPATPVITSPSPIPTSVSGLWPASPPASGGPGGIVAGIVPVLLLITAVVLTRGVRRR